MSRYTRNVGVAVEMAMLSWVLLSFCLPCGLVSSDGWEYGVVFRETGC
jgi:hypothetical protein